MKTKSLTILYLFLICGLSAQSIVSSNNIQARGLQSKQQPNSVQKKIVGTTAGSQGTIPTNAWYKSNICGLNYVYGSVMTETRSIASGFNTNGTGFPAAINISGLPTSCSVILQAYLYYDASYTETAAPTTTATLTNPAHATATYASTIVGTGPEKCWGETGTASYRADVTAAISGNGTYTISLDGFANAAWEVDGCTLFIIYQAGPTTGTTGTLFMLDGAIVENSYNAELNGGAGGTNYTIDSIYGFDVCNASSNASAWFLIADQTNDPSAYTTNIETVNAGHTAMATTKTFPNSQWNFNLFPTTVTNGQTATTYSAYQNDDPAFSSTAPFDCFNWIMMGMYWQNTGCVNCLPAFNASTIKNINCNGEHNGSVTIHVNSSTGTPPYTYTWSPNGATDSTATGLSQGTYTVLVEDAICNTAQVTVAVSEPALLEASMSIPINSACYGQTGSIAVIPSGGTKPYTYSWTPEGGDNATGTGLGAGTYTVTVTDNHGCLITQTDSIIDKPFTITSCCAAIITAGTTTSITASGNGDSANTWLPEVKCLNPPLCNQVIATPTITTTYTVTAIDSSGCLSIDTITIDVEAPCFNPIIPNVFTPNAAGTLGLNNVFYINTSNLDSWNILIYDRWGKELFNSTNPTEYWDGNIKSGGAAPAGVYYYIIQASCHDNTYKKDGFLQLIR